MRVFHFSLKPLKIEKMIRSTLATLTKQTMGRVRRTTSTKQRSMTLVVRNFAPQVTRQVEEGEQLGEVLLQQFHHRRRDPDRYIVVQRNYDRRQLAHSGRGVARLRTRPDGTQLDPSDGRHLWPFDSWGRTRRLRTSSTESPVRKNPQCAVRRESDGFAEVLPNEWLGGRDSNPDTQIQSLQSYR